MKADVKKNIFQFIVFPAVLIAAVILAINVMGYVQNSNGADTERIRQTAASLEARGLYQAALDELDRYRETTILSREDEADLLFKMGKIADENLDDCERALKYFTMADALNPEASWSKESGKRSDRNSAR